MCVYIYTHAECPILIAIAEYFENPLRYRKCSNKIYIFSRESNDCTIIMIMKYSFQNYFKVNVIFSNGYPNFCFYIFIANVKMYSKTCII